MNRQIYIYIYMCVCVCVCVRVCVCVCVCVYFGSISSLIQISLNIIDMFCLHILDPFVLPCCFYRIRRELIYVLSIVVCIPSTFCLTLDHHWGRTITKTIFYKEVENIKHALINNGFPNYIVDEQIKRMIKMLTPPQKKTLYYSTQSNIYQTFLP